MRTIGIRVTPKAIIFAIYDVDENRIVNIEPIKVPSAMGIPDSLKYIRNNLLDVLREYSLDAAGIRITEPNAQRISISRVQIEGVIQEAFASSNLKKYYVGQISTISAKLSMPREYFKKYVSGEREYALEGWSKFDGYQREAVLCSLGAVHA